MSFIRPKKSLGQHFLRDDRIARSIVDALAPARGDVVLEIGPGDGALTRHLVSSEATLVLVDIDQRVVETMQSQFGNRVRIIHSDILAVDPAQIAQESGVDAVRIIGNIPYYITNPILFHFLDRRQAVRDMVLMVQREVARRIAASPGSKEYGIVSVTCQLHADVDILFDVRPGSFHPPPEVTSSVIRLRMLGHPRYEVADERFFRTVVRGTFGKRRKTLRNSLQGLPGVSPAVLDATLLSRRPEQLSVAEFARMSNTLYAARTCTEAPSIIHETV